MSAGHTAYGSVHITLGVFLHTANKPQLITNFAVRQGRDRFQFRLQYNIIAWQKFDNSSITKKGAQTFDESGPCFLVKSFNISFFTNFDRCIDVAFEK